MCADLLPGVYSIMEPQQQQLMVNNRKYQADGGEAGGGQGHGDVVALGIGYWYINMQL